MPALLPRLAAPLLAVPLLLAACAPRQAIVQVPTFQTESVRLQSLTLPGGGSPATATLSLMLRVQNPNPYPVRLARAGGHFFLEGQNVGAVELPNIDLPANGEARQQALLSLPITLANLGQFVRVGRGEAVSYRIDGNFTVDAGLFGKPNFGPYTLSQGVLRQPRILP
ncbi:LEA type 2 family protein [Deinococcus peraridilitoris]|uniref:Conserved secreted protein n=1 Tax=Deinococcus peraridilitoris (strain DSM 19664 / LMG 22246 / CIP 109416 / KR-200) TaxID=937777 RepID=K9ZWH8_DEIPD|nr:LEA type 2 family protein [Deinococcus peraridilitoris]AFZ66003.1 conserved secreted protein [Deinococcus peraridilitoris DSM 19664]